MIPLSAVAQGQNADIITLSSANEAIFLDETYKKIRGKYPGKARVKFIIPSGVQIISHRPDIPTLNRGVNWDDDNIPEIINHGSVYGRGGMAGRSGILNAEDGHISPLFNLPGTTFDRTVPYYPKEGGKGGDVVSGKLIVHNYGTIGSGGGGGGGAGVFAQSNAPLKNVFTQADSNGAWQGWYLRASLFGNNSPGVGGGAPYGLSVSNYGSPRHNEYLLGGSIDKYRPASMSNRDIITSITMIPNGSNCVVRVTWRDKYSWSRFPRPVSESGRPDHNVVVNSTELSKFTDRLACSIAPAVDVNPDSTYIPYSLYDTGYGVRFEAVSPETMIEDKELMVCRDSTDGSLTKGGLGGRQGMGTNTSQRASVRSFRSDRVWRFKKAMKKLPPVYTKSGWSNTLGTTFSQPTIYNDPNYVEDINYEGYKGGDGGDIGKPGTAGGKPDEYVIVTWIDYRLPDDVAYGYPSSRVFRMDSGLEITNFRNNVKPSPTVRMPPSSGGLPGYLNVNGAVIKNQVSTSIELGTPNPLPNDTIEFYWSSDSRGVTPIYEVNKRTTVYLVVKHNGTSTCSLNVDAFYHHDYKYDYNWSYTGITNELRVLQAIEITKDNRNDILRVTARVTAQKGGNIVKSCDLVIGNVTT